MYEIDANVLSRGVKFIILHHKVRIIIRLHRKLEDIEQTDDIFSLLLIIP